MPEPNLFKPEPRTCDEPDAFVRVAVERGLDRPAGLTYRASGMQVGQRVRVPLGRSDKPAPGIVIAVGGPELLEGFDPRRVKPILKADDARLPTDLVRLARWMADHYICPIGMVLTTMLPAAVKAGTGRRTRTLVQRVDTPTMRPRGVGSETDDAQSAPELTPSARAAWAHIKEMGAEVFPVEHRALAQMIGAHNAAPINRLVDAGLLCEVEVSSVRAPDAFRPDQRVEPAKPRPDLTDHQHHIVEGIGASLDQPGTHLVHGVTGSGKTEVYLRLIERVLAAGHTALVLVPEIALTPQTAGRFLDRFASVGVAVLHSGLTASQRHKQWAAAASGDARVVIGARSAVFAPLPDLGIIVVDEEHDTSYKQDRLPRYHARDVAIMRAHTGAFPCVLGSATPALESWHNTQRGLFTLWSLPQRIGGGAMPRVSIVDLANERKLRAQSGSNPMLESIGPTLAGAIERTLTAGGQALLLLNRRGFACYVSCPAPSCGWSLSCDQCDATMVAHRKPGADAPGFVRCHHCLSEQLVPKRCPVCDRRTTLLGFGTQRVEKEIESKFATTLGLIEGETFARVDSDTMRSAKDYFDVLGRFGRGELKLLLGTQMIAKGLDYPNVRLVGVLNADTALSLDDFRAAERTFQLVSQVAGRAGRGGEPGEVIVQTMNPTEPAIVLASRHDYKAFARRELNIRTANRLPPVWRMARIVVRDEDPRKARTQAERIAEALRRGIEAGSEHAHDASSQRGVQDVGSENRPTREVLVDVGSENRPTREVLVEGPGPCPVARIAGFHRFSIEVYARTHRAIQRLLSPLRDAGLVKSDAQTAIDIDPVAVR